MDYTARANFAYKICVLGLLLEIALLFAMTLIWLPEGKQANWTVALILTLPLIAFLPWVFKRSLSAFAYLAFLMLWYVFLAVPSAMDARYGFLGRIELANVIMLFTVCLLFVRYEQRRLGISITR